MGLCISTPRPYLYRDSGGHLVEATHVKPSRAEKREARQQANALKEQMRAQGFKNVRVQTSFG